MEHRHIPLPILREYARDAAERSSERLVAAAIGIGYGTLGNFIKGTTSPHPRVKRLVALWYLRQTRKDEDQQQLAVLESALDIFVGKLPISVRVRARISILTYVLGLYRILDVPAPPAFEVLVAGTSSEGEIHPEHAHAQGEGMKDER